jgi:choline dehydrogenase-like flavoprotein
MKRTPPGARRAQAEIAVVGSGPGGSITACLLAEAGRDVLLIEEGPHVPLESCAPFSLDEMVRKYRNGGLTVALGPTKVAYVEGRCVGGGSEVNSGLYHRTPREVLDAWGRDYRVEALGESDLGPHFEACEREVSVSYLPGPAPTASMKMDEGARRLGWRSMEVPRWFRYDPPGNAVAGPSRAPSTMPRGSRRSMTRTFIPRAVAAGCRLMPETRVEKIRRVGGRWRLEGTSGGSPLEAEADEVFVCGGAIQTPALLRRSGITRNVGDTLRMHPTVKLVARFDEEVNALDMGVPVHQVKEFAPRFSFGCSISHPPHLAMGLVDHPTRVGEVAQGWKNMAVYYAMISGEGSGTIRPLPGFRDPLVRYGVTPGDLSELSQAMKQLARLLFRAGAVELFPSIGRSVPLASEADVDRLPDPLPSAFASLMTIHLTSSCPMGEDTSRCAVDSFGRVHGQDGLYVADASLLCTQPGVNPQGTIMALARRNALRYLGQL